MDCSDRTINNALYYVSIQPKINQHSPDQEYEQIDDSKSSELSFKNALFIASPAQQADHLYCDPEYDLCEEKRGVNQQNDPRLHLPTASSESHDPTTDHHYSSIEQAEQEHSYHVLDPLENWRSTNDDKESSVPAVNKR